MLHFSYNSFCLGALIFLAISLSNFIYVWLCKVWKVKITEFSIFLNPFFSLLKKEINGTIYQLGWLPIGAYIKPLGMLKADLGSISIKELPFSFLNKSRTKQLLFRLIPSLVWLFALLLSLCTLKGPGNIFQTTAEMFYYILVAIKTMFGLSAANELVMRTNNMLIDNNIISFALTLLISVFLVLTSLSKIMGIYSQDGKNINWMIKLPGFFIIIFGVYLTFWKIPTFVFSFFSFRQNVSYVLSFILGLYLIGSLAFVLAMILEKLKTSKLASVTDRR
jgi:membrane-associated protease RseP (regulator of RpoE activity)